MKHPHIATGKHMTGRDARFRINTAPGIMEPKYGVNEAHGSFLQRAQVIELRDELNEWLAANPTVEEQVIHIVGDSLDPSSLSQLLRLVVKASEADRTIGASEHPAHDCAETDCDGACAGCPFAVADRTIRSEETR